MFPNPTIKRRTVDRRVERLCLDCGVHPIVARIVAARPFPKACELDHILDPKLSTLSPPRLMADITIAADRIAAAVIGGECIGVETDHDCDGQTSHAVLHSCLTDYFHHPKEKIRSYIGHRIKEGYGLSEKLTDRILSGNPPPTLIITADNGSSDEPSIRRLAESGIDVVVTDHHEIPAEGPPPSAYACVNPTRKECDYPDPFIAGCMVSWLVMAQTRQVLVAKGHLAGDAPNLKGLLDYVAVGTVADCVSIARSHNNRAVVKYGLTLIEKESRPCWSAVKPLLSNTSVRAEDLAFKIGPLLNSDGRLYSAHGSVDYLLSREVAEAKRSVAQLVEKNGQRKAIEKELTTSALEKAVEIVAAGAYSVCIFLEEGHSGVHGIVASRVREKFGRPAIMFSPKAEDRAMLTGSARGVDALHVRDALQHVEDQTPGIIASFGGHRGAAGLSVLRENYKVFCTAFETAVRVQLRASDIGPEILTDGVIGKRDLNLSLVDTLRILEPFGREFDPPVFEARALVMTIRRVGQDKTHAQLSLRIEGTVYQGIWFRMVQNQEDPLPVQADEEVNLVFSVMENNYRNRRSLKIQVIHAVRL